MTVSALQVIKAEASSLYKVAKVQVRGQVNPSTLRQAFVVMPGCFKDERLSEDLTSLKSFTRAVPARANSGCLLLGHVSCCFHLQFANL